VARLGKDAARRLGLADGDLLTVTGPTGSVTLPVQLVEMPDRVVWLPMRSPGSEVRAGLGAGPGAVVTLSAGGAA
jgi:NADH-quinone oxidoreductase subunit G